ncbi:MAG: sugar transferase [Pseudomonadota bacterium]
MDRISTVAEAQGAGGLRAPQARHGSLRAKESLDFVCAAAALLLLAPLMGLIALAIRVETPGPALFRQPRYGLDGRRFDIFKFRTMRSDLCDASGGMQTLREDPRITRVGWVLRRSSLDELPQLLNVLRGEMSLIGPRAHPCGMRVDGRLCEEISPAYMSRHRMKPGITGLAQVSGSRGPVETEAQLHQRVALDLEYIETWSPGLDMRILLRTLGACVRTRQAY